MIEVAVLGFGVVGSGIVEVLDKNSAEITRNAGQEIRVKYILDMRDFPGSPYERLLVKDFGIIERDPGVSIVVEAIGGAGQAFDFARRTLSAGKSLVTSNKELVAERGYELLQLAGEKGVNFLFEAAVGGGIPVIRPVAQCLSANKISEIYGILNGTTNYILSEMEKNGAEFSAALADAQKKGYAEQDPTADIEGTDACRKICILSSLAFGKHIYPDFVPAEGITGVTRDDMQFAGSLGYRIKLLGRARAVQDKIAAYVAPHLVSFDNILSGVSGVTNGVTVRGNASGDIVLVGAGAGKLPTASAAVADVIDAVKHMYAKKQISWQNGDKSDTVAPSVLESSWYIRTNAERSKIEREFGEVVFAESAPGATAFKTAVMSGKKVNDILARGINALSLFRVMGDY
ncbi:MAG: homoserine dehydrogenase [Oscillospiraceae bacterium]|nr:homoserine dehydrogenase [Oscillospiraceae bacterium]